jgi:hypothetical protein
MGDKVHGESAGSNQLLAVQAVSLWRRLFPEFFVFGMEGTRVFR